MPLLLAFYQFLLQPIDNSGAHCITFTNLEEAVDVIEMIWSRVLMSC